jgi:hypothetical protein
VRDIIPPCGTKTLEVVDAAWKAGGRDISIGRMGVSTQTDDRWRQYVPLLAGVAILIVAGIEVILTAHSQLGNPQVGQDTRWQYVDGVGLSVGHSPYLDWRFTYPPSDALLWALVAKVASYHTVVLVEAYLQPALITAMLCGACYLAMRSRLWLVAGSLTSIVVLRSDTVVNWLWLENSSTLLASATVLMLAALYRKRWGWFALVLGLTILVKPLLAPYVVILFVCRRWRELIYLVLGVGIVVAVTLPIVGSVSQFVTASHRIIGGSDLVGPIGSMFNESLVAIGVTRHLSHGLVDFLRLCCVVLAIVAVWRAWRFRLKDPVELFAVANACYAAGMLAGDLSEIHYEYATAAGMILILARSPSLVARALIVAASACAVFSSSFFGFGRSLLAGQLRFVLYEVFLLLGSVAAVFGARVLSPDSQSDRRPVAPSVGVPHMATGGRPSMGIGIAVVAYNAESTLVRTLDRVPSDFRSRISEIIICDDASHDATFDMAQGWARDNCSVRTHIVRHPKNLGYGGNQKVAYDLAIEHGLDVVVLLHGDGQYAPEFLPDIVAPFEDGGCDAVFGSRMMIRGAARRGGMPLYKRVGNKSLTAFENGMLRARLSEFHSGYRAYTTDILRRVPFRANSDGFNFDTQIIVQVLDVGGRIKEIPIPTFYGDEICYVNGMKYAKECILDVFAYRRALRGRGTRPWIPSQGIPVGAEDPIHIHRAEP